MGVLSYLLAYFLGGITFLPLCAAAVWIHVRYSMPVVDGASGASGASAKGSDDVKGEQEGYTSTANSTATTRTTSTTTTTTKENGSLRPEKRNGPIRTNSGDSDKSGVRIKSKGADGPAGFFTVTREFVPGGINGKPPERPSYSSGSGTPNSEKSGVAAAVYNRIFDNGSGESVGKGKKAKNVFYVVLRHRCLMLYDDVEQLEVRHVVPLADYIPTIYAGQVEDGIPEGELYIKRNAIRLKPKAAQDRSWDVKKQELDTFYLFSEDCSLKEDLYFAMIAAQQEVSDCRTHTPLPLNTNHLIALVQRLHASEEHMETRWLNALLGRMFLGIYRTQAVEEHMRRKIAKKISRVSKPGFLSDIELRRIDVGNGLPYITNPRLRELNVDGSLMIEMDVSYNGGFSMEISTNAAIHLGSRIKKREVSLVLSCAIRSIQGHLLVKIKPPPSNRLWVSFETMPKLEFDIVPIVSSRQITYGVIVRAIESRIREVLAETCVQPYWDDTPFFDTLGEDIRGGIWGYMRAGEKVEPIPVSAPLTNHGDEIEGKVDPSDSASVLTTSTAGSGQDKDRDSSDDVDAASINSYRTRTFSMSSSSPPDSGAYLGKTPPKAFSACPAVVSADNVNVNATFRKPKDINTNAASAFKTLNSSQKSPTSATSGKSDLAGLDSASSSSLRLPPKAVQRRPFSGEGKSEITRRLTDTGSGPDSPRFGPDGHNALAVGGAPIDSLPSTHTIPTSRTEPALSTQGGLTKMQWPPPPPNPNMSADKLHPNIEAAAQSGANKAAAAVQAVSSAAKAVGKWYKTRQGTNGNGGANGSNESLVGNNMGAGSGTGSGLSIPTNSSAHLAGLTSTSHIHSAAHLSSLSSSGSGSTVGGSTPAFSFPKSATSPALLSPGFTSSPSGLGSGRKTMHLREADRSEAASRPIPIGGRSSSSGLGGVSRKKSRKGGNAGVGGALSEEVLVIGRPVEGGAGGDGEGVFDWGQ